MIQFKIWYLTVGVVLTGWVLMLLGIGFFVWARWDKGKAAKIAAAFALLIAGLIIIVYQAEPWNWQVLYNIGGLK